MQVTIDYPGMLLNLIRMNGRFVYGCMSKYSNEKLVNKKCAHLDFIGGKKVCDIYRFEIVELVRSKKEYLSFEFEKYFLLASKNNSERAVFCLLSRRKSQFVVKLWHSVGADDEMMHYLVREFVLRVYKNKTLRFIYEEWELFFGLD